jgi:EmrB/QacA subfamily drug resistance transporter
LGGWLVDSVTWRAIFWVNIPIGIIGFAFSLLFLREHTEERAGAFDGWGFVLSGAGLALVLFALSRGPNSGWTSPIVLASGVIGTLCFVMLVVVELRIREPMLQLRLFANRLFRTSNLAFFMAMASLLSQFLLLTLFLQQLAGLSALQAGLAVLPFSIGTIVSAPIVGSIYPRIGPRRLIAVGLLGAAVTSAMFLAVDLKTSLATICGIMLVRGLAYGAVFVPVQVATYATISSRDTGRASSLFSTNRQVAQSIGVAIAVTVLATRSQSLVAAAIRVAAPAARQAAAQQAVVRSFHDAFATTIVMAALGIVFALLIHDSDAAPTMRRVRPEPISTLAEAEGSA